jgi:hypothetical protein
MALDKKRDFSGIILIVAVILIIVGLWKIMEHVTKVGPERINSMWVKDHNQVINDKTRDQIINTLLQTYSMDKICFDNNSGSFLDRIIEHKHEDGKYDGGWYLLDTYEFIQLQNGTYVIKNIGPLTSINPDLTGIYCKSQEVK